jgi:transposase, IS5 family
VGRSTRGHHLPGIRKHTRKLKTYLGRVLRDIERKLPASARSEHWQPAVQLAWRLFQQQRSDSRKLYSVHAPETECIAKGKLRKPYEFGHKVEVPAISLCLVF